MSEGLDAALRACGAEQQAPRQWAVQVPVEKRGPLAVAIGVGDHTLTLRTFVMRGPDRAYEDVYHRLLRKNDESRIWRFALDKDGDVFAVADLPTETLTESLIDGSLGLLAALVDESYEGILRTGFDIPQDTPLGPPPT
jgi:Putative bacterial sensory transduction regulator